MTEQDVTKEAISAFETKDLATMILAMSSTFTALQSIGIQKPASHPAMMLLAHRIKSLCVPTLEFTLPRVKAMAEVAALNGVSYATARF